MNQPLGWEDEASWRTVNAQPWEPLPGMVKRQYPSAATGSPPRRAPGSALTVRGRGVAPAKVKTEARMPETSRYGLAAMRDPA